MRLIKLKVKNFRSLKELEIDFEVFTVLIGENDAGKSSVLDLAEMCLCQNQPDPSDFYQDEIEQETSLCIEAVLEFKVELDDAEAAVYSLKGRLGVKYVYDSDGAHQRFYWGEAPKDERLLQDLGKLTADEQRELIREIDPLIEDTDLTNAGKRKSQFEALVQQAPKKDCWIPTPMRWGGFLPRFEHYSALDYSTPESLISKTLKQVFEDVIYQSVDESDGQVRRELIEPLRDVQQQATEKMCAELEQLEDYIKKYDRRVQDIGYEPQFDFSNSMRTGDLRVDTGRGLHVLAKTGAGTRRRMFIGISEWDRDVTLKQAETGEKLPTVIRGYDEPDTNLHYRAQRRMYQAIEDIVSAENSRVQALICTHSMTMIDRAPAQNIRLLHLDDAGCTAVSKLETGGDPEVEQFLNGLARELGITNSLIFYERCFILIEGETEENALPLLYRKIYGRSLLEDGIRVINLNGNGAIKEFLRLLSRNRQAITIIFIDRDAEDDPAAKLTARELRKAGFSEDFIDERIVYMGTQEFEDAFSDETIAECLRMHWPKESADWSTGDVVAMRSATKFSKSLQDQAYLTSGQALRKPDFGKRLALVCAVEDVPSEIEQLFELARKVSGI